MGPAVDCRRYVFLIALAPIVVGEPAQPLFAGAVAQPRADLRHPEAVVEFARRVPVEHVEIDPSPAALDRDSREPRHQPAADALTSRRFGDVEIFEIQPRPAEPGRKPGMEQRRAGRLADKGRRDDD